MTPEPRSPDAPAGTRDYAEWLFAQECRFVAAAASIPALPPADLDEVAFAGRSNVGKSSLINALTRRRALARVSGTPGRTQEIVFFELAGRLRLVDLPGYGYAAAPKAKIASWNDLIDAYLSGRPNLRRVYLLVDSRHGLKPADRLVMAALDRSAVVYQIVLTKCDKLGSDVAQAQAEIGGDAAAHPAAHPEVLATSATKGHGIEALRAAIAFLGAEPEGRGEAAGGAG
ncbi:MAG: YihA family ribosome biogenesis GTP-binding protein [Alphaproteobacteria bacterium]|nr:YihA family ribosome biogenesis GTP-binding protein [Alphaproteobacteria bacterium]